MAIIPYDRITNLQNDQALAPSDPYPAPKLDQEYNAIKITTDDIIQHLDLIQRDDGQLENDSVGRDQLREEVLIGFGPPEQWVTGHDYRRGDTVFQDNAFWFCEVDHTSTVFADDHAAGYWSLIADFVDAVTIGSPMYVQDGPPVLPTNGQQWYESDTGNTFLYYIEPGDTVGQWVQIDGTADTVPGPPGPAGPPSTEPGPPGPPGAPGLNGELTQADADLRYVNTAGDTMTGGLQINGALNASGAATFGSTLNTGFTILSKYGARFEGYIDPVNAAGVGVEIFNVSGDSYIQTNDRPSGVLSPLKLATTRVDILSALASSSATTGALTVVGGVGIGGALNVAGTVTHAGSGVISQNSQSAAYTTVLGDAGKHVFHPSADTTARTWTIAANASVAYPVGTAITFVNQNAAGVITIAVASDTMRLAGAGTTGNRTLAANGVATAIKVATTEWLISGTGLT